MTELKRVAIVGSARIPFARGGTAYADETNLSMLADDPRGLADKYGLKGEKVDEVIAGAVINHSRDFNIAREAAARCGSVAAHAGDDAADRLRHQPPGRLGAGRQDCFRADR